MYLLDDSKELLRQGKVLAALEAARVVEFAVKGSVLEVGELCDLWFGIGLTQSQAQGMVDELQTLVDTMEEQ